MLIRDTAYVLSRIDYKESSLISRILTRENGMISTISKGIRTSGKKARSHLLEVGNKIEVEMDLKPIRNLQFLQNFRFEDSISRYTVSPLRNSMFFYMLELLPKFIMEGESNKEYFDLLDEYQQRIILSTKKSLGALPLQFTLELCQISGYPIHPWLREHHLEAKDIQRGELQNMDKLLDHLLLYIGKNFIDIGKIKSLKILRDIRAISS